MLTKRSFLLSSAGRRLARYGEIARSPQVRLSASGRLIPQLAQGGVRASGAEGWGWGQDKRCSLPGAGTRQMGGGAADLWIQASPQVGSYSPTSFPNRTFRGDSPISFSFQNQGFIITTFTQATPSSKGVSSLTPFLNLSHLKTAEVSLSRPPPANTPKQPVGRVKL